MARICIVTTGPIGINPRVRKEAGALVEAGHDVSVVTTRLGGRLDELDDEALANASWVTRRVPLIGTARKVSRVREIASRRLHSLTNAHWLAESGISYTANALRYAAMRVAADLYIAHYPPALAAAARAAKAHGGQMAFDAEDFHPGDLPQTAQTQRQNRVLDAIETAYLPQCAYITAASPRIASRYAEAYGLRMPKVVLNVFPKSQAPAVATAAGIVSPGPSVYWFSQTIGPNRGLECAIRAIRLAKSKPHFYLRGTLRDDYRGHLMAFAEAECVVNRLHLLEPGPASEMGKIASLYDIGLSSEPGSTANNEVALGNKIFTYLLAGIPFVASSTCAHLDISRDLGEAMRIYEKDSPTALAAAFDHYLLSRDTLKASRATAWHLAQSRYNWDLEKAIVQRSVTDALNMARPTRNF